MCRILKHEYGTVLGLLNIVQQFGQFDDEPDESMATDGADTL